MINENQYDKLEKPNENSIVNKIFEMSIVVDNPPLVESIIIGSASSYGTPSRKSRPISPDHLLEANVLNENLD